MSPSVTDWIQAIAVLIGITFALWEFVLHDRASELAKRESVFQLILAGQSDSLSNAAKELSVKLPGLADGNIDKLELIEISSIYSPFEAHFNSWGFCFKNDLCDKELTLLYICEDLINFKSITDHISKMGNDSGQSWQKPYTHLLEKCKINRGSK